MQMFLQAGLHLNSWCKNIAPGNFAEIKWCSIFVGKDFKLNSKSRSGSKGEEWDWAWDHWASIRNDKGFSDTFYWSQWQKCSWRYDQYLLNTSWTIRTQTYRNATSSGNSACSNLVVSLNTPLVCFTPLYRACYAKVLTVNLCHSIGYVEVAWILRRYAMCNHTIVLKSYKTS